MSLTPDSFRDSEVYISSLDAQACYVDEFITEEVRCNNPDITRVYRFMHVGTDDTNADEWFDIKVAIHRNRSGMESPGYGRDHVCTDLCRSVVPVIPVGCEHLLPVVYRWWNWDGSSRFFNDGVVLVQDAFRLQRQLDEKNTELEVVMTYEQLLPIFPVKEAGGYWYLP